MTTERERQLNKTLGELVVVLDDIVGLASQGDFLVGRAYRELRLVFPKQSNVVLIVDDDPVLLKALARSLKADFQIVPVNTAEDAIEVLRTTQVTAVIADLELNAGTGLDVLRVAMREQPEAVRILHSGAANPLSSQPRVGNVVQHLVPKPADAQKFRDIIRPAAPVVPTE